MTEAEIDALFKKAIESIKASLEREAAAADRAKERGTDESPHPSQSLPLAPEGRGGVLRPTG